MFKHGMTTSEKSTPVQALVASQVQVVIGTAPVNRSKEADVINQPFYVHLLKKLKMHWAIAKIMTSILFVKLWT